MLISLLLLNSCDMEMKAENTNPGNLIIVLDQNYCNRTLTPDRNMNIAYYRISGSGPNNATFSVETTEATLIQQGLALGEWIILVEGLNSNDQVIANGTAIIEIFLNQTTEAVITLSLLAGFGSLEFDVSWSVADVTTPSIESELISTAGTSLSLTASTLSEVAGNAYYSVTNLEAGYYTLIVRLMDGNQLVIGSVETVWIAKNTISFGNFSF